MKNNFQWNFEDTQGVLSLEGIMLKEYSPPKIERFSKKHYSDSEAIICKPLMLE